MPLRSSMAASSVAGRSRSTRLRSVSRAVAVDSGAVVAAAVAVDSGAVAAAVVTVGAVAAVVTVAVAAAVVTVAVAAAAADAGSSRFSIGLTKPPRPSSPGYSGDGMGLGAHCVGRSAHFQPA